VSQAQAHLLLREGIVAGKEGNKPLARRLLRKVTELDPRSELAWLWLAGVAEQPQDTVACLQRVLEINPANDRARGGLRSARLQAGIAEAKAGRRAVARHYLQDATADDPTNVPAWLWLASVTEVPPEAVECYARVLALEPANERARAGLVSAGLKAAAAEARAGSKERARRHLLQVAEHDPKNEAAWLGLAELADTAAEAFAHLEQALNVNPGSERARAELQRQRARLAAQAPSWQCPLCRSPGTPADRCPACGAVLTLDDLDALFSQPIEDPAPLREAVERCEALPGARDDYDAQFCLGLAYANGKQLPLAVRHFQAALRLRPHDRALRGKVNALVQRQREAEAAAAEKAREALANQRTVLIVDDSPTVRKLVALTLERQGYRVRAAADGTEALRTLREQGVPDLILLDISMPGMDGYQLCKLLKQSPEAKHAPVVMLSGKDGFFDKVRGRMAGSTAYITKPFAPEALVQAVQKHCQPAAAAPR
jgi:twitching motility two-component system response regulator PilG